MAVTARPRRFCRRLRKDVLGFMMEKLAIYYERAIRYFLKSHFRERRDFRRGLESL
jgi:hypothetical protein